MAESSMEKIPLPELSRKQRRVLGVLLEKGFTTPDQYPLTLKATTTGCNQKNNRDPVSAYDEDTVADTLGELNRMGFVGVLHPESGRTERYRHYMRHRTGLTEHQLAVLTELLLRGKQQPGELRTRASRMAPIDSQEELRIALQGLMDLGLARANGSLERRGVEVDHNLYPDNENHDALSVLSDEPTTSLESRPAAVAPRAAAADSGRTSALEEIVEDLRTQMVELRDHVSRLQDEVSDLRRQLGA